MRPLPFTVDYTVTDAQLLEYGVSPRVLELSRSRPIRPGAVDFDIPYAMAVWDANEVVALAALRINNPDAAHVWFPPHHPEPWMGNVRHD